MKLTNLQVKSEQFYGKTRKVFDGKGLYLHVTASGKYWRYKYNYANRERVLSIGVYPEVSLKMAREAHDDARALLRRGVCPSSEKRKTKLTLNKKVQNTFSEIAQEWYDHKRPEWSNPKHAQQVINTLKTYAFPYIGELPIADISPMEIMNVLNRVKDKPETCTRVKQRINAVLNYAVQTGRATINPAQSLPNLGKVKKVQHRLALPAGEIAEFFEALRNYNCPKVRLGLRLLMLTFVRSSELRKAEWSEIHGDEWHIPAERMKMKKPLIVPLADWTLETLNELRQLHNSHLLFPADNNAKKPINENAFLLAMQRMGYKNKAVPHGFRSLASSILNESGLFAPDVIERQLAHTEKNAVRAAYNRAEYMEQRHKMMQWYSDYLKERY